MSDLPKAPREQMTPFDPAGPMGGKAGIDFTELSISAAPGPGEPFSFIVLGDTDTSATAEPALADAFSAVIEQNLEDWQFLLHTGDIVYPMGDYRSYHQSFLRPYRFLLRSLPPTPAFKSHDIVFRKPVLAVPGNHDYAEASGLRRFWTALASSTCNWLRQQLKLDLGCYGGQRGEAYQATFLDRERERLTSKARTAYLAEHYSAKGTEGFCLSYEPERFTRLPNRYYRFRYGAVEFFALDSNSWCCSASEGRFDSTQLDWFKQALLASHQDPSISTRIVYLHHSPYTTEESRWQQSETLYVRRHLRMVLDSVAAAREGLSKDAKIVDLFLSGHAHCFEHLRTENTGHADSFLDWVVCGGSGDSLRCQRRGGAELLEKLTYQGRNYTDIVARSLFYAGVKKKTGTARYSHSLLQVKVIPGDVPSLELTPVLLTQTEHQWQIQRQETLSLIPNPCVTNP